MKYFRFSFSISIILITVYSCGSTNNAKIEEYDKHTTVSYEGSIEPIISNYCTTCHSGSSPMAKLDLSTYSGVKNATQNGNLLDRINNHNRPMPQSGLLPKEIRNTIARWAKTGYMKKGKDQATTSNGTFNAPVVTPINIDEKGFDFLEKMQGHWVGNMEIMNQKYKWFAFDYRAISPSHVHGIYDGGTMGNLMTSFFITEFNGTKTIMARNGGLLNGIYRMSYFVLDKVENTSKGDYYRFVDSYGGEDIMYIEVFFKGNEIDFYSYTSGMGTYQKPTKHMHFHATGMHEELSVLAAQKFDFPQNKVDKSFGEAFPMPDWGNVSPITSRSFMWEDKTKTVSALGKLANDPYPMEDMPNISSLKVNFNLDSLNPENSTLIFLSKEALTDNKGNIISEFGYLKEHLANGILSFPMLTSGEDTFTFTYLHPGTYYITVVSDLNGDFFLSEGDKTHPSKIIHVASGKNEQVTIGL